MDEDWFKREAGLETKHSVQVTKTVAGSN